MEYLRTTVSIILSRVTNTDTRFAAEIDQTNRWHKQQSVTKTMLRICNPKQYELGILQSPKLFRVTNPDTHSAADNISAASL